MEYRKPSRNPLVPALGSEVGRVGRFLGSTTWGNHWVVVHRIDEPGSYWGRGASSLCVWYVMPTDKFVSWVVPIGLLVLR